MMTNLDLEIDRQHAAAERAEADARAVIARLQRIPGAALIASRRRAYGAVPNPWRDGEINLSAQTAITRADLPLANYLARLAGKALPAADDAALERERQREASVARLQAETERMRQSNAARRQQQERAATYGTWSPIHGRPI